ncbi:MAG TPA: efflux RND transporter periplasmic adaptor subunit [Opitutaceae bacterium]|jgi:membrane fusion protein (multidrug efflux system)|nr:efflux RND transporter periplasmic adaptor subunit [Opitutaceae bacterium]
MINYQSTASSSTSDKKWGKKLFLTIGSLLAVIVILAGIRALQIRKMMTTPFMMPPDTVTTAQAHEDTWAPALKAVGSLAPVEGATLSNELPGTVTKIAFESGAHVKKGDLLVQLDASAEEAQLASAEASAEWARLSLKRAQELRGQNANSQSDLDSADAQAKQAEAAVANLKSAVAKKIITAPFDGRIGIRTVNLGQYLPAGTAIVSLQSLDPIYVDFSLPQQQLAALVPGLPVHVTSDALPAQTIDGKITAIDPQVDNATRNVQVQATLDNHDEALRPGMFANVAVELPAKDKVLIIPETAVLNTPYGDSVFVVEDGKDQMSGQSGKVLRQQFVQLGVTRGDFVSVISGLKPGETVVTSGVFKLRNKESVVIDNKLAPDAQLAPKPSDS